MDQNRIQLYEDQPIRTAWDEEAEEWYFSIVDVVRVLTEQVDPLKARKYWNKLKQRLNDEGSELVTNCHQLKMTDQDGKRRLTDVANTEQLLRLIQSIPSKRAEPFKLWLAQVGSERISEMIDPELSIERAMETYARLGYPADWINSACRRSGPEKSSRTSGRPTACSRGRNTPSSPMNSQGHGRG